MAVTLGWAGVAFLVIVIFVNIGQSVVPITPPDHGLGQQCRFDHTCKISNSYCQQRLCECKSGYRRSINNDSCIAVPELGEHCTRDQDCAYTKEASRCADNVCKRCSEGSEREFSQCTERIGGCAYHEYDGNCFNYRRIGELCEVGEECWIYRGSNITRKCTHGMCVCAENYDTMSGPLPDGQVDQCIMKSSAAKCASISALLSIMLLLVSIVINNM